MIEALEEAHLKVNSQKQVTNHSRQGFLQNFNNYDEFGNKKSIHVNIKNLQLPTQQANQGSDKHIRGNNSQMKYYNRDLVIDQPQSPSNYQNYGLTYQLKSPQGIPTRVQINSVNGQTLMGGPSGVMGVSLLKASPPLGYTQTPNFKYPSSMTVKPRLSSMQMPNNQNHEMQNQIIRNQMSNSTYPHPETIENTYGSRVIKGSSKNGLISRGGTVDHELIINQETQRTYKDQIASVLLMKNDHGIKYETKEVIQDYQESVTKCQTPKPTKPFFGMRTTLPLKAHLIDNLNFTVRGNSNSHTPSSGLVPQTAPSKMRKANGQQRANSVVNDIKVLDGFAILHACRVTLPQQAIRANLSSLGLQFVNEDDLTFFSKTLAFVDLSDNLLGESLNGSDSQQSEIAKLKTLNALQSLNLASNNIKSLHFMSQKTSRWMETQHSPREGSVNNPFPMSRRQLPVIWPRLEILNLSYNRIPITSISYLSHLGVGGTGGRLKELNLQGNGLTHLPDDLSFLRSLEVLILSHNHLSSSTSIFNPNKHFLAFSSLPRLKRLDLSHNQLKGLHLDELLLKKKPHQVFQSLVELDLSFNLIDRQENIRQAVFMKSLNIISIIGNPLVMNAGGKPKTAISGKQGVRKVGGKPKIMRGTRGGIELGEEKEPPTIDCIKELERVLQVENQTLLVWKPAPEQPPMIFEDLMKPINISQVLQQEKPRTREFMVNNSRQGKYHHRTAEPRDIPQTSGQANIEAPEPVDQNSDLGDDEDDDDDPFEQEMNRIRGPRLIKGEAINLQEIPISNEGDFGIAVPQNIQQRGSNKIKAQQKSQQFVTLEYNNHWMQVPDQNSNALDNLQPSVESSVVQQASIHYGSNSKKQSPRPSVQSHVEKKMNQIHQRAQSLLAHGYEYFSAQTSHIGDDLQNIQRKEDEQESDNLNYSTAYERLRRKQHTMIFEGFSNINNPALSPKIAPRAYDYMTPTLSKLAKTPAHTAYHDTAPKMLATKLADQQIKVISDNQIELHQGSAQKLTQGVPNKQEIYEAWKVYKEKATATAKPAPIIETKESKNRKMKMVYGDNEHFNALGARWPIFSQTRIHHTQLGRLMHGLSKEDKSTAYKKIKTRVLDARIAQALDQIRDIDSTRDKDVLDRQAFRKLNEKDRKLLYKQYGFSDSDNDLIDSKNNKDNDVAGNIHPINEEESVGQNNESPMGSPVKDSSSPLRQISQKVRSSNNGSKQSQNNIIEL